MKRRRSAEQPGAGAASPPEAPTRKRRAKRLAAEPVVRGGLPVFRDIFPWERELLLPIALEALADFVEANEHATPDIDKKTK